MNSVVRFVQHWPNWAGLVLSLTIIYWLRPLEMHAMAIVFVVCVGFFHAADALRKRIAKDARDGQ